MRATGHGGNQAARSVEALLQFFCRLSRVFGRAAALLLPDGGHRAREVPRAEVESPRSRVSFRPNAHVALLVGNAPGFGGKDERRRLYRIEHY